MHLFLLPNFLRVCIDIYYSLLTHQMKRKSNPIFGHWSWNEMSAERRWCRCQISSNQTRCNYLAIQLGVQGPSVSFWTGMKWMQNFFFLKKKNCSETPIVGIIVLLRSTFLRWMQPIWSCKTPEYDCIVFIFYLTNHFIF